jgi:hypothetical protein
MSATSGQSAASSDRESVDTSPADPVAPAAVNALATTRGGPHVALTFDDANRVRKGNCGRPRHEKCCRCAIFRPNGKEPC